MYGKLNNDCYSGRPLACPSLQGVIDHEKTAIYQLVVVASDRGHDPLSSEATVVVRVEDLNDNAPALSIRTLTGSNSAEIPESSPIGTFVAHVTVVDQDSGANGRVNCSVSSPTAFGLIQKYATEYQLVTAAVLDRERAAQYGLTIRCQDGGGGGGARNAGGGGGGVAGRVSRVTQASLQVVVLDVNDNAPVFSQTSYQGSIIENNYIGVSVVQVIMFSFGFYQHCFPVCFSGEWRCAASLQGGDNLKCITEFR